MFAASIFLFPSVLAPANTYRRSYKIPSLCYCKLQSVPHGLSYYMTTAECLFPNYSLAKHHHTFFCWVPQSQLTTILGSVAPCLLSMSFLLSFICWPSSTQSCRSRIHCSILDLTQRDNLEKPQSWRVLVTWIFITVGSCYNTTELKVPQLDSGWSAPGINIRWILAMDTALVPTAIPALIKKPWLIKEVKTAWAKSASTFKFLYRAKLSFQLLSFFEAKSCIVPSPLYML